MTGIKRDELKAQRTKKKRQRRMNTLLGVGAFILIIIIVFISPTIINQLKPAGNFTRITPSPRPLENGKTLGDPNAKVKVLVFEDFQCPNCKSYSTDVESQLVASTYITGGQVYYEFMQWPFLDDSVVTKESHQAANATMCALEQSRFWDYHDILFANQGTENGGSFNDKRLQAFAESLGLDMTKFNQCFGSKKYSSEVEAEVQQGVALGVHGTPSVFVDGKEVTPGFVPSWDQLKSAIDTALAGGG